MKPNKLTFNCQECGKPVTLPRSQAITRKTCGRVCMAKQKQKLMKGNVFRAGKRPSNSFEKGHTPWNAGLKGIHLSPSTEFAKERNGAIAFAVGTVRNRVDKSGTIRAWIKLSNGTWRPRAVVVWENHFGPVPKGCVIHHHDRDALNDSIDNLTCMTRKAHINEHRYDIKPSNC